MVSAIEAAKTGRKGMYVYSTRLGEKLCVTCRSVDALVAILNEHFDCQLVTRDCVQNYLNRPNNSGICNLLRRLEVRRL